ncbi:uncharacterized protein LOC113920444 [Zalophus californianus]|uniref:Uncharacterized protein LOC113920444 n=1 Tax=Zalophus californianus TaxID=9704 RepID=A0A6P9FBH4_ZALCA|nr:uncharacterized protein LOC113920444 [Zalophus californianus]
MAWALGNALDSHLQESPRVSPPTGPRASRPVRALQGRGRHCSGPPGPGTHRGPGPGLGRPRFKPGRAVAPAPLTPGRELRWRRRLADVGGSQKTSRNQGKAGPQLLGDSPKNLPFRGPEPNLCRHACTRLGMAQLGQSSAPFGTLNFEQAVQKEKNKLMFILVVGYPRGKQYSVVVAGRVCVVEPTCFVVPEILKLLFCFRWPEFICGVYIQEP